MGMTYLPPVDAFDCLEDCTVAPLKPSAPTSASRPAFETPARPSSRIATSTPLGGAPSSSGRARRNVTDVEAWKEMQERAWEVGMTTRKKQKVQALGVEGTEHALVVPKAALESMTEERREGWEGLDRLEQRRKGVLSELDGLQEKYSRLFALVKSG